VNFQDQLQKWLACGFVDLVAPFAEVIIDGSSPRKVVGKRMLPATYPQDVKHGVENLMEMFGEIMADRDFRDLAVEHLLSKLYRTLKAKAAGDELEVEVKYPTGRNNEGLPARRSLAEG
jgi:hypothetical protein